MKTLTRTLILATWALVVMLSGSMASGAVVSHWRFEEGPADGLVSSAQDSVSGHHAAPNNGNEILRYRTDVPWLPGGNGVKRPI